MVEDLGKVVMDWKKLSMQFHHEGTLVTLQSNTGAMRNNVKHNFWVKEPFSLHSLLEDCSKGPGGCFWTADEATGQPVYDSRLTQWQQREL